MKIVLTTLPSEGEYRSWITPEELQPKAVKYIPLGLLSLATNIEGHEVKILDPYSDGWSIKETIKRIMAESPDIVGISAITRRTYSLYQLLWELDVPWKVVGGPHATYHAEEIMEAGANAVFVGAIADKEFSRWVNDPNFGIIYCGYNISDIKIPNRELVDYKKYSFKGKVLFEAKKRMVMYSSIGCPNQCIFCSVQQKKISRKTPSVMLNEMEYLRSLGAESIHILDDNFNISNKYVSEVMNEMSKRKWNMEWSMRGQVNFDYSLIPRMKAHGLKRVHVGIEALDDKILGWMGKRQRVNDIVSFCKSMADNGIDILGYFIVGTPVEKKEYLTELPLKIKGLGIKYAYVNVLFPEPDTKFYNMLLSSGVYKKDYWDEYMCCPEKDYSIPHPYGEVFKNNSINRASKIMKEFSEL